MDPSQIAFEGQLTADDFRRIQWLSSPWIVSALPWLIVAAFAMVLLTGGWSAFIENPVSELLRASLSLAFAVLMYILPRRSIRKAWESNSNLRATFSGSVSGEGLSWRGELVQGQFPWSALHSYREGPDLLLVYTSNRQAVWLLPRFFSSESAWTSAVAMVTGHLKKR